MRFWLLPLLLVSFFVGCSKETPLFQDPVHTLKTCFISYPVTADPRKSGDFISSTLVCLTQEGLTRCLPGDLVEPALAEKIALSEDKKTYTFFLREAFWSDQAPITAQDFVDSWSSCLDPEFPSLCAYLFFPIENAKACKEGKLPLKALGVKALSEHTLQVTLERPCPYFLSLTAFPLYLPVPPQKEGISLSEKLICSGPFCIEKVSAQESLLLKKNEHFWNKESIYFDALSIEIIPDETTAVYLFEQGELDFIGGGLCPIPLDAIEYLDRSSKLKELPMSATTFCTFNTDKRPFHHPLIRKALSFVTEKAILPPKQTLATTLLPPSLISSKLEEPLEARALFKKALQELHLKKEDLPRLTLTYKTGQAEEKIAILLQKAWKEKLGIWIDLQPLDPKTHLARLHNKDYDLAIASWICQYHDPLSILDRFTSKKLSKNYPSWESSEYQAWIEKANETTNIKERNDCIEKASQILVEQTPFIPLYHWSSFYLASEELPKVPTTVNGGILFERFTKKS